MAFPDNYDVQLKKNLEKPTRPSEFGITTGDDDWDGTTLVVELPCDAVEEIAKKDVINIKRGFSFSQFSIKNPTTQLWDFLKIERTFRVRGTITKDTWANLLKEKDKLKLLMEDGGTMTFTWHSGNTYTVNMKDYKVTEVFGTPNMEYYVDLIEGTSRST